MTDLNAGVERGAAQTAPGPLSQRMLEWARQGWRPAGTVVAVVLALLLMGHVVNGKNGLTVWHQKRAEDKQLQMEIDALQRENAQLRAHVDRLKSNPEAIEHEAREKLHYAKRNEVIVALPPEPQAPQATPGK